MKNVDRCDNAAVHLGGLTGDGRVTVTYHVECVEAASGEVSADWQKSPQEWAASLLQPRGSGADVNCPERSTKLDFLSDCNILMEPEVIFKHNSPAVNTIAALSCPLITDIISER